MPAPRPSAGPWGPPGESPLRRHEPSREQRSIGDATSGIRSWRGFRRRPRRRYGIAPERGGREPGKIPEGGAYADRDHRGGPCRTNPGPALGRARPHHRVRRTRAGGAEVEGRRDGHGPRRARRPPTRRWWCSPRRGRPPTTRSVGRTRSAARSWSTPPIRSAAAWARDSPWATPRREPKQVAGWAPAARVVKAFNTTGWPNMKDPDYAGQPATMLVCGDDEGANRVVADLATSIGFEAIDAGPLRIARLLEPLAMLWIHLALFRGMGTGIAFRLLRR